MLAHLEMPVVVGTELGEVGRYPAQTVIVIFYLGGSNPPASLWLFFMLGRHFCGNHEKIVSNLTLLVNAFSLLTK